MWRRVRVSVCVCVCMCVCTYSCASMQLYASVTRHARHVPILPPVERHARVTQKTFQDLPRPPVSRVTEFMNGP